MLRVIKILKESLSRSVQEISEDGGENKKADSLVGNDSKSNFFGSGVRIL